jgi:hypothetical protein
MTDVFNSSYAIAQTNLHAVTPIQISTERAFSLSAFPGYVARNADINTSIQKPYSSSMQRAYAIFYCNLSPVCIHHIFRHCLINDTKKLLKTKCVFWFSLQLLSRTFLILRRIQRDIVKNIKSRHVKYPLFLPCFNATWIFWTDFR